MALAESREDPAVSTHHGQHHSSPGAGIPNPHPPTKIRVDENRELNRRTVRRSEEQTELCGDDGELQKLLRQIVRSSEEQASHVNSHGLVVGVLAGISCGHC